jgi:lipopolysaccharide/colanic/teichoic acid biosynthesis glycosyltransferase
MAAVTKHVVDVVLGAVLAMLLAPAMLLLATVLAVQTRAWPLFVHDRIGRNGRSFRFPKLRTLPRATHCYADKTTCDLRPASRFAAFLRARHLDELPQLFLVALGRLSLVGPRPKMLDEHEPMDPLMGSTRTLVRQGCTGLWQVGEHTSGRVSDTPLYDLFYLRYGSLRMDAWILWRTVAQACGAGGVTLGDVPRWTLGHGFVRGGERERVEVAMFVALGSVSAARARAAVA